MRKLMLPTKQDYVTVIADGSNKDVVSDIKLIFDLCTKQEIGSTKCKPLSESHPTTLVIETRATQKCYDEIKYILEGWYPGLCIFNAIVS